MQRDLVLRWIEQISRVIARLLGRREEAALNLARDHLDEASAQLLGPLQDVGIYCINAARYLFQDDPLEVMATDASNGETRFSEVPEMVSAILTISRIK